MTNSSGLKKEVRELRIIAGRWRSRKLSFDALPGLRPTPDRVRETLFNWLQPWVSGSRCLDMFAGSGVLGFEALSRGASSVVFIDQQAQVIERLRGQAVILGAENVDTICASATHYLRQSKLLAVFDIVFVDPPFSNNMVLDSVHSAIPFCSDSARIYVESEVKLELESLPSGWQIEKSKKTGSVYFHLLSRDNVI